MVLKGNQPVPARKRTADAVDRYLAQWRAVRPDVDTTAMSVSGRAARAALGFHRLLGPLLARHALQQWEYDVLATLRRTDAAEGLSMTDLTRQLLLAAGSTTHRIDGLVRRRLVTRRVDPASRRRVLVTLTPRGRTLIDAIVPDIASEITAALAVLTRKDRKAIDDALRTLVTVLERSTEK
jgi:DNA-binding MarR family transcriptional regulator